jgi:hypothetical protein
MEIEASDALYVSWSLIRQAPSNSNVNIPITRLRLPWQLIWRGHRMGFRFRGSFETKLLETTDQLWFTLA